MDEAFDRLSIQWPRWQGLGMVELVETIVRGPLFDLAAATKNKDETKFAASYDQLTTACNTCHQATKREFVVIQDPKENMFPDQDSHPKP